MATNNSFLHETARDLYDRYGDGISSLHMLFPSRRARLFFIDALASIAGRPLWQPNWMSVDDLMSEVSGLHTADRVRLIAELYKVYVQYHKEPFDKFYFWGDMLLTDFDTIDKYMVDAGMLFRNISDIKELEADVSYLTPEQLKIVAFWGCFRDGSELSDEKQRFLEMWRTLGDIYTGFRRRLTDAGIAYGGMMHRTAAEKLRDGSGGFACERHYAVVGFNALSECEKQLFRSLAATGKADFYWDYDSYYCADMRQEAGMFLRDNIRMFPSRADISHDNMAATPKHIYSVAASSNAVQCKYLSTILDRLAHDNGGRPLDKETAIVLTDENLLLPVLHSLPDGDSGTIGVVNVTMGYPLRRTLAYSFVERLIELQNHRRTKNGEPAFYHADIVGLLAHPYISDFEPETSQQIIRYIHDNSRITMPASALRKNELLEKLFAPADTREQLQHYLSDVVGAVARLPYSGSDARQRTEFLAVVAEELAKTANSLAECGIGDISTQIYTSLLRRHLQTLRIPFEGEPLEGIQIMGILETRNLDFKNVIIMSMTDDNFPGALSAQSSFVPYNLRAAYALPTPEHHEGVYAYYFYRLIQRARNVYMMYCAHADEKSTGEPSRYIRQLEYESDFAIERIEVGVDVNMSADEPVEIAKTGTVAERLMRFVADENAAMMSPTAFGEYVACPLQFYFSSIARLSAPEEISDDVDARMFGNILHAAVQTLYGKIRGEASPGAVLRAMVAAGEVERAVGQAIDEVYLKGANDDYTGNLTLVREIVVRYIRNGIIPYDAAHDSFAVTGTEERVSYDLPFVAAGTELKMHFGGKADRIDSLSDGALRVVDYKTGQPTLVFRNIESLFGGKGEERHKNIIQTMLYSMMLYHSRHRDVEPALYYVRNMHRDDYSPLLRYSPKDSDGIRYAACAEEFETAVRNTLAEMFDMSTPFRQCEDGYACRHCNYKRICNR